MSNTVTIPIVNDEISPWRQVANEDAGTFLAGDLLKFVKGDWLLGDGKTVMGSTTLFVVNMHEVWRGWVRWWDHQPTDHAIGRVVDRFVIPPRSTLTQWQDGKDPWQPTRYVVMQNADSGALCTFATSSDGGIKAVGKLCDRFDSLRHKYPGLMPVVLLEGNGYQHKDKSVGWVDTPILRIIDWRAWDESAPT